jgi:hypothetical protein
VSERAAPDDIDPAEFFRRWAPDAVNTDPERRAKIEGVNARIQFELEGPGGGAFWLELANGGARRRGSRRCARPRALHRPRDVAQAERGEIKAPTA